MHRTVLPFPCGSQKGERSFSMCWAVFLLGTAQNSRFLAKETLF